MPPPRSSSASQSAASIGAGPSDTNAGAGSASRAKRRRQRSSVFGVMRRPSQYAAAVVPSRSKSSTIPRHSSALLAAGLPEIFAGTFIACPPCQNLSGSKVETGPSRFNPESGRRKMPAYEAEDLLRDGRLSGKAEREGIRVPLTAALGILNARLSRQELIGDLQRDRKALMAEAEREGCHHFRAPGYDRFMERLGSAGHDLPPDLAGMVREMPGLDARDREIRKGVREVTDFVARRREIIDRAARRRPDRPHGKGRVGSYGRWARSAPKMIARGAPGQGSASRAGRPEDAGEGAGTYQVCARRRRAGRAKPQGLGGDSRQGGGGGMPPLLRRGTGLRAEQESRVQLVRGRRKVDAPRHASRTGVPPVRRPRSRQGPQGAGRGRQRVRVADAPVPPVAAASHAPRRGCPARS